MSFIQKVEEWYFDFYCKHKKILWLFYLFLWILLSYRFYLFAMDNSLDMQWYPTLQFWGLGRFDEAVNPYLASLNGDNFMANIPNYMPLMYYIMFPFGVLDWENAKSAFAFFNFFLFFLTLLICFYKTKRQDIVFLLSCFVILGYTYGNVITNAQSTIFIGMWIVIAYYFRTNPVILTLSLSFVMVKHSVGVPIVFAFFLIGYRKEACFACLIVFLVFLVSALKFQVNPIDFIKMMLQVNSGSYTSSASLGGPGDIISLSQKIFHKPYSIISSFNLIVYALFAIMVWKNKLSVCWVVSGSIVLSLVSLPHLGYDYYLLFIVLVLMADTGRINFVFIFTLFISLFLWRCSFLKPWIDAFSGKIGGGLDIEKTHWAMNMGIPFCIFLVICFTTIIFLCLLQKDIKTDKISQKLFG